MKSRSAASIVRTCGVALCRTRLAILEADELTARTPPLEQGAPSRLPAIAPFVPERCSRGRVRSHTGHRLRIFLGRHCRNRTEDGQLNPVMTSNLVELQTAERKQAITRELLTALKLHGAPLPLLATIAAWRDGGDDASALHSLRAFNYGVTQVSEAEPRIDIASEIYKAAQDLFAPPDLLGVLGSWCDGDEELALDGLRLFNATGSIFTRLEWVVEEGGANQLGFLPSSNGVAQKNEDTIMNASALVPEIASAQSAPANDAIARLWSALDDHVKLHSPVPPRTARLVNAGEPKMAQKLVEEAGEVAVAAIMKDHAELIRESADLLYHLTTLWVALDIRPQEIWAEMAERESVYGLAEKRAKNKNLRE